MTHVKTASKNLGQLAKLNKLVLMSEFLVFNCLHDNLTLTLTPPRNGQT